MKTACPFGDEAVSGLSCEDWAHCVVLCGPKPFYTKLLNSTFVERERERGGTERTTYYDQIGQKILARCLGDLFSFPECGNRHSLLNVSTPYSGLSKLFQWAEKTVCKSLRWRSHSGCLVARFHALRWVRGFSSQGSAKSKQCVHMRTPGPKLAKSTCFQCSWCFASFFARKDSLGRSSGKASTVASVLWSYIHRNSLIEEATKPKLAMQCKGSCKWHWPGLPPQRARLTCKR